MSRGSRVFILRKILEIILTVLIVTMISFVLMKLSPVDAAEAYARCRGMREHRLLFCHALPTALMSIVPNFFQMLALNLAGSIVLEQIFSIPGLGYLIMNGVINRDPPVIHATILLLAICLSMFNILADVIRRWTSHGAALSGGNGQ